MTRRGRRLSEEERALWRKVAQTANRRAPSPPREDGAPEIAVARTETAVFSAPPPAPRIIKPVGRPAPPITTPAPDRPAPSGLDRSTETRLRKGKRAPDARIDLHGMTAARAHSALIRFISQSRAAGSRLVLVITGKGAPGDRSPFGAPAPGVLRREAPVWLSTPPLSEMVVNVSQAHPRHGGGGALYVYLKKPRG